MKLGHLALSAALIAVAGAASAQDSGGIYGDVELHYSDFPDLLSGNPFSANEINGRVGFPLASQFGMQVDLRYTDFADIDATLTTGTLHAYWTGMPGSKLGAFLSSAVIAQPGFDQTLSLYGIEGLYHSASGFSVEARLAGGDVTSDIFPRQDLTLAGLQVGYDVSPAFMVYGGLNQADLDIPGGGSQTVKEGYIGLDYDFRSGIASGSVPVILNLEYGHVKISGSGIGDLSTDVMSVGIRIPFGPTGGNTRATMFETRRALYLF